MTVKRFRPGLVALWVAAGVAWGAPAGAQFVTAPTVSGAQNGVPNSIHERLYPGVATGGILTKRESRTPVQLGSGTDGAALPSVGAVARPTTLPLPGTQVIPQTEGARPRSDALKGLHGSSGDELSGVRGLFTAPSEQNPLGRVTP